MQRIYKCHSIHNDSFTLDKELSMLILEAWVQSGEFAWELRGVNMTEGLYLL